jgi:hypothetical protein
MNDQFSRRAALAGAASLYLLILAIASTPDLSQIDWGDAPAWATVCIASVALAAAWWAGHTAAALLRVERQREDRAERIERERRASIDRAEQADLVAAWNDRGKFVVLNGSPLPIWDVELRAVHPERAEVFKEALPLIAPGELRVPFVPVEDAWGAMLPVDDILEAMDALGMRVEIQFRDAAGRAWRRDRFGMLTRIDRTASDERSLS